MNREPLFFENSQGKERVIAEVCDMEDAFKEMHDFCTERNFRIYYTNYYIEECPAEAGSGYETAWRITFDVGSWSEFFHIYFDTFDQAERFRNTADFEKPF